MHAVPKGTESHFKVVVVSDKFEGMSLLERHRCVQDLFKEELELGIAHGGIHALSIVAKTPEQWKKMNPEDMDASPHCLGGSKHDLSGK